MFITFGFLNVDSSNSCALVQNSEHLNIIYYMINMHSLSVSASSVSASLSASLFRPSFTCVMRMVSAALRVDRSRGRVLPAPPSPVRAWAFADVRPKRAALWVGVARALARASNLFSFEVKNVSDYIL